MSPDVRISAGGGGGTGVRGGSSSSTSGRSGSGSSSGGPPSLSEEGFGDDSGDPSMPYIPAHLDYCLFELLKNASRATVESAKAKNAGRQRRQRTLALSAGGATMPHFSSSSSIFGPLPPIVVRICDAPGKAATFRISDQGGGIPEEQQEAVWRYGFTTAAGEETGNGGSSSYSSSYSSSVAPSSQSASSSSSPSMQMMDAMMAEGGGGDANAPSPSSRWRMGGLGFGLPLSRLYARYFGGDLKLVSMPGYGVDAFLTLEHLVGSWEEPGDEHVPVRPSAAPREGKEGSGGGGGGGGGGGKTKEGASSPSVSSNGGRGSEGSAGGEEQRRGSAEAMPGAALP